MTKLAKHINLLYEVYHSIGQFPSYELTTIVRLSQNGNDIWLYYE